MPHSFSYAVSMNLEHSIKEGSHERYPDHLQCFRNIKKIKYPDFQAMTLKIKLSKKKPLKITAGAPDQQSETIPMQLEHIRSCKQSVHSSHVDTSSDSTQAKRGAGAPLFITPIHPENNVKPQKGTSIKGENDLKGSTNHRLARERVTQVQGNET